MGKRNRLVIPAALLSLVFGIIVLRGSVIVLDLADGNDTDVLEMITELTILVLAGFGILFSLRNLNRLYDKSFGYSVNIMFVGPWVMNAIMLGLLIIQGVLIYYEIILGLRYGYVRPLFVFYTILLVVLDIVALRIYAAHYDFLRTRMERIERLIAKGSMHGARRFFMLVEDMDPAGQCIGNVYGAVCRGDSLNVLLPGLNRIPAKIRRVVLEGKEVDEAEDCHVRLTVEDEKGGCISEMERLTVLTDIVPCAYMQREVHAENPRLTAMLAEFRRFHESDNFISTFVYDICHTEYIVPSMEEGAGWINDITDARRPSAQGYFMISSAETKHRKALPVFTGWSSVKNYDEAVRKPGARCTILSFPEILRILPKDCGGIIINPSDDQSYYVSDEMISLITGLEGYVEEFGTQGF